MKAAEVRAGDRGAAWRPWGPSHLPPSLSALLRQHVPLDHRHAWQVTRQLKHRGRGGRRVRARRARVPCEAGAHSDLAHFSARLQDLLPASNRSSIPHLHGALCIFWTNPFGPYYNFPGDSTVESACQAEDGSILVGRERFPEGGNFRGKDPVSSILARKSYE